MKFAPLPHGDEGRRMALEYLRMHQLGQPLPACRFGSNDQPPRVGYITATCTELKESRYVNSNYFNLYVRALYPKSQRPSHANNFNLYVRALYPKSQRRSHANNWKTSYKKKGATCHGGSEEAKWRAAQLEMDELGWSIVVPSLKYVVQHSADTNWVPSNKPGRPSKETRSTRPFSVPAYNSD
eukprot:3566084-Pleurochrysis_carterae.AAC.1